MAHLQVTNGQRASSLPKNVRKILNPKIPPKNQFFSSKKAKNNPRAVLRSYAKNLPSTNLIETNS